MAKKTKAEKQQEIKEKNAKRLEDLKSQLRYQESLKSQKEEENKTKEKLVKLSNKLIDIKKKNSKINPETKRPQYESMQEYVDVSLEISEVDFKERVEPAMNTQIIMNKGDIDGIERAMKDLEEEIKVSELNEGGNE